MKQKIDAVFDAVLSAVRNTLDPDAVADIVGELATDHGIVVVNAALEAVESRLETERRIVAALRAIPPWPADPNEQHGHA
jgi:hypothetical protein